MRSNALYFPYIDVPKDAWTFKALLYWDKLASIVPFDHMDHPEQMSDFMQELLAEGLVEPIFPSSFVHQIQRFDEIFIRFMEARMARTNQMRQATAPKKTRVHVEKLGEIPAFLVEAGLACQVDYAWYEIDTPVANLFMAYLASCLGAIPDVNATPVTDKALFASIFGRVSPLRSSAGNVHRHKAREVALRSLLPVPNEPIALDKLLAFKRSHGHLLPALRTKIEAHCTQVSLVPNPEDRIDLNQAFVQECKGQVAEIEAAMRPHWSKITFGSIAPLFGAGFVWQATDASNIPAFAGSALCFAGSAYQAISSIRDNRVSQSTRPLAYIAHARAASF